MVNINQSAETLKQRLLKKRAEMEQCDHLFAKTQEGYWTGGCHSSDYEYTPCTIKCLKCGLTNYHINMDIILKNKFSKALKRINPSKYYWFMINDEVFSKQFGGITSSELDSKGILNLISDKVIPAINPIASNEELFPITKELFETEKNKNMKARKKTSNN